MFENDELRSVCDWGMATGHAGQPQKHYLTVTNSLNIAEMLNLPLIDVNTSRIRPKLRTDTGVEIIEALSMDLDLSVNRSSLATNVNALIQWASDHQTSRMVGNVMTLTCATGGPAWSKPATVLEELRMIRLNSSDSAGLTGDCQVQRGGVGQQSGRVG